VLVLVVVSAEPRAVTVVDDLYTMIYQQKTMGPQRSTVRAMTEVIAVRVENGEVVLDLRDRKTN